MTVEGYDVSVYQQTTPNLRTTGRGFLFARATYGTRADAMYPVHASNVRTLYPSAVLGAYCFGRSSLVESVAAQWAAFIKVAHGADLLALDLESDGSHASMTETDARRFISLAHLAGRKIGLYHSASGYPSLGQDFDWIAKWSTEMPARDWDFWQYSGTTLDKDRFNGDMAALYRLAGRSVGPHVPLVHIAHGANVRIYTLSSTGCIKSWTDETWTNSSSQAHIYIPPAEVHRSTCETRPVKQPDGTIKQVPVSGAWTVRVKDGKYAGRWIQTRANGVTVS